MVSIVLQSAGSISALVMDLVKLMIMDSQCVKNVTSISLDRRVEVNGL